MNCAFKMMDFVRFHDRFVTPRCVEHLTQSLGHAERPRQPPQPPEDALERSLGEAHEGGGRGRGSTCEAFGMAAVASVSFEGDTALDPRAEKRLGRLGADG